SHDAVAARDLPDHGCRAEGGGHGGAPLRGGGTPPRRSGDGLALPRPAVLLRGGHLWLSGLATRADGGAVGRLRDDHPPHAQDAWDRRGLLQRHARSAYSGTGCTITRVVGDDLGQTGQAARLARLAAAFA